MQRKTILVIESDADLLGLIAARLEREGYEVRLSRDGEEGLRHARENLPDLVILNTSLSRADGLKLCETLRRDAATRHLAIVMLSARREESVVLRALAAGADDCLRHPVSLRELVARVEAVLRRHPGGPARRASPHGEPGPVVLDARRREMRVDGRRISLTPPEVRLLEILAANPGRLFTPEEILEHVAAPEPAPAPARFRIDACVRSIRRKLGRHGHLIESVEGRGHRLRSNGDSRA